MTAVSAMESLRERGTGRFAQLGWPTTRLEEWKYTSLAAVANTQWTTAPPAGAPEIRGSLAGRATVELIFFNGQLVSRTGESRVGVRNLASHDAADGLGAYADLERNAMVALNAAHFADGAVIEIPANFVLDGFIHLLYISSGEGIWSHPRNFIIAGKNSQAAIVETYAGSGRYFTNAVTELVAHDGAVIDHTKVVCESNTAFHVGTTQFHLMRSSTVTSHNISASGALVRNDVNGALVGEGASLVLNGLFVAAGKQHVDNHTLIEHVSQNCTSYELYKGILDDSGRGVFDGRIVVRPNAQKTVSRQENRNLLLSETAVIDSKPTLEIHNDDVKCNHGSTIGQIDDESMFYLRSRGLGEDEARNLLVYAFAGEIIDRLKIEPIREQIRRVLFQQLPARLPERRGETR